MGITPRAAHTLSCVTHYTWNLTINPHTDALRHSYLRFTRGYTGLTALTTSSKAWAASFSDPHLANAAPSLTLITANKTFRFCPTSSPIFCSVVKQNKTPSFPQRPFPSCTTMNMSLPCCASPLLLPCHCQASPRVYVYLKYGNETFPDSNSVLNPLSLSIFLFSTASQSSSTLCCSDKIITTYLPMVLLISLIIGTTNLSTNNNKCKAWVL